MTEKLGGRKFIWSLFIASLAFSLVLIKALDATEWVKLVEVIGATYVAGNVATKFILDGKKE